MQHLPSEDSSSQASNTQGIEVSENNLTNSPIGQAGGSVNQASRDINYFINSVQGDLSEDKVEKIRQFEESLRTEFKEKLDKAALLVNDLRGCIEYQLTDGKPKDDAAILKLLDELQSTLGKESRLKLIDEDLEFCHEGGIWLHKNKHRLAVCAKDYIFNHQASSTLLGNSPPELTYQQIEERFIQDLETYLAWISLHLRTGTNPKTKDFQDGIFSIHLDLPDSLYKGAFEALNANFVDPIVSGLSDGAANNTANYINRFLVDRDLSQDTEIRTTRKSPENKFLSRIFSNRILLILLATTVFTLILLLR